MIAQSMAWALSIAAAVPTAMLALECHLGAGRAQRRRYTAPPPYLVVMPAHDEAPGIGPVIEAVLPQLRECDRLLVVADNCSDDTALLAAGRGAQVIERHDPVLRGKGYALGFARDHIAANAADMKAEVVIVLDADCLPDAGALARIAAASARRGASVQGAYLMEAGATAGPLVQVSCFAFMVKNLVRQRGLGRICGLALLQGSGMAFPRRVFATMDWAGHSLVEDLDMGLELLVAGHRVQFEAGARFHSAASSQQGTGSQRRRWEHGMMQTALGAVPRLLGGALRRRDGWRLAFVALDLLVPPTVLLLLLASGAMGLVMVLAPAGGAPALLAGSLVLLATGLARAWWNHGRTILPAASLLEIPRYVAWKLPLLAQFLTRRERNWTRTERLP